MTISDRALELFSEITPQAVEDLLTEIDELRDRLRAPVDQQALRLVSGVLGVVDGAAQIAVVQIDAHVRPPETGAWLYEVVR